ncbi:MAG: OmpA family protein [Hyphomicrobium sp.]
MMAPHLLRMSGGLIAALMVAAALKFALFDLQTAGADGSASQLSLRTPLAGLVTFGAPLALLAAIAIEIARARSLATHIALGLVATLAAAGLATRDEGLHSPLFTSGARAGVFLILIGVLASAVYWVIAGRRAGWRGADLEKADSLAAEAFQRASAYARAEPCVPCLAAWSGMSLLLFALLGWMSIDGIGLRERLVAETEQHARSILKATGHSWATFRIVDNRGIVEGRAPDETTRRDALDKVQDGLSAVVGFPGILAEIDNEAIAIEASAAMSQQLAEAARREQESRAALEEARIATREARAAAAEAKRMAQQQALAVEAELKRRLDEQALAAQEKARQQEAVSTPAPPPANPPAPPAADETAGPTGTHEVAKAEIDPATEVEGRSTAVSPAIEQDALPSEDACTPQDLAMIESSRIAFPLQRFVIAPDYTAELDRLASSARACAPRPIVVYGHADINGDNLFNPALGLQRAEAVRDSLIARGVGSSLVLAKSTPPPAPFESNADHDRSLHRTATFRSLEASQISRDATLGPEERAKNCESDLAAIMAQSIIHFPTASAGISVESQELIRTLAAAIKTCGSVIVTIEGHTDKKGPALVNQGLSEARAYSVREALVAAGADPTRLASRGFASTRPYDAADTAAAYALNRRIEFRVSGKFTSTNAGGP